MSRDQQQKANNNDLECNPCEIDASLSKLKNLKESE
jgi:hypothetical protein